MPERTPRTPVHARPEAMRIQETEKYAPPHNFPQPRKFWPPPPPFEISSSPRSGASCFRGRSQSRVISVPDRGPSPGLLVKTRIRPNSSVTHDSPFRPPPLTTDCHDPLLSWPYLPHPPVGPAETKTKGRGPRYLRNRISTADNEAFIRTTDGTCPWAAFGSVQGLS